MPRPLPHDDALRRSLVDLASEAVAAGGSGALSLRTVAARAGTTTAAIYTLFGGRDGLLDAVVEEGFSRFAAHLAAAPRTEDPGADLLALGVAYRRNALANPHYYRVMFGAPPEDTAADPAEMPPVVRPTFGVLEAAVARTGAPDPQTVALRLWALAHGLVSLELAGLLPGTPQERDQRYVEALQAYRR